VFKDVWPTLTYKMSSSGHSAGRRISLPLAIGAAWLVIGLASLVNHAVPGAGQKKQRPMTSALNRQN